MGLLLESAKVEAVEATTELELAELALPEPSGHQVMVYAGLFVTGQVYTHVGWPVASSSDRKSVV